VIPVLTADEMRRADRHAMAEAGVPGTTLMENAGGAVARVVEQRHPGASRIVVLCGHGMNGGDGFVVTRRLSLRAEALLLGSRSDVQGDARHHLEACERGGGRVTEVRGEGAWPQALARLEAADLIVDAVLGTGLRSAPNGLAALAIAGMRARRAAGVPVVAVDLPSGVPSDSGALEWPVAGASCSVTFAAAKRGHVLPPACNAVGELVVADIGLPAASVASVRPALFLIEAGDAAAAFPRRERGAHKGDFGHVLVIAGSLGKTGAAVLAATGALRSGAGLVTVATPAPCLPLVANARAELMTEPLAVTGTGGLDPGGLARLLSLARERDAVVLGPGLGQDEGTRELVRRFVRECPVPLVIDADGLNAIAPLGDEGRALLRARSAATILTPHPGEAARLAGLGTPEIQRDRPAQATALARETGAIVILKGERTVVAEPGGRAAVSPTGNPGMATGGTGDVLAGVTGSLLARHGALLAATAAPYVHGLAGDLAARRRGEDGLLAGDVAEALPEAIEDVRAAAARASQGGAASASS
jgi:ADP-dependent NAD(P)H-hydrate dehydratase / NAD(P)H-hydrate epimerase